MPDGRILIVDDEREVLLLYDAILRPQGYRLTCLTRASSGILAARTDSFDLVITDVAMPEMDGLSFLQNIRRFCPGVPAIISTGYGGVDEAIRAIQLTAHRFIIKPFLPDELTQVVEETIVSDRRMKETLRLNALLPVFDAVQDIFTEIRLPILFEKIVKAACLGTHSEQAILLVTHPSTTALKIEAAYPSLSNGSFGRQPVQAEQLNILTEALRGLSEPLTSNAATRPLRRALCVSSFMATPIVLQEGTSAVLALYRKLDVTPYNDIEVGLSAIIAGEMKVAVANVHLFDNLEQSHFRSVLALGQAIESKDAYTGGHCKRMVEAAAALIGPLGLSSLEGKALIYGAALHDLGKIGVHEAILRKPGRLTKTEYELIKTHSALGAQIVDHVDFLDPVIPMILHHQERYDGTGYPKGLKGEAIPFGARIVAVIDAYDAMTSNRSYRLALPKEVALSEMRQCAGTQFDPQILETFISVTESGAI